MKKRDILNTFVLNGSLIYMSTCALIGIRFDPEEGAGSSYKMYMIVLFIFGTYSFFRGFINRKVYNVKEFFPLFVLSVYVIVGFFQLGPDDLMFLQMVCFSVPATCIALNMKERKELLGVMKLLDLFLPFFALSFIFMVKNLFLSRIEGTGTYNQLASYFCAYCFLIDLYLLRYHDQYEGFSFLKKKWYSILKVILLPYFVVVTFFCGGRGAFVTILMGLLFNIGILRKINPRVIRKFCVIAFVVLFVVLFVISKINSDYFELLSDNFGRIAALISNGSIDTSASSGRDDIWAEAFNLFLEKPLLGYGLFSYLTKIMYPHNIFLEILLQGGLCLLTIFLLIFLAAYKKYHYMLKLEHKNIFLMPIIIFSFTQLMFSSSYSFEPYFWFSLTYIYNYSFYKTRLNERY